MTPAQRKTASQKMRAMATAPSPARLRAGTICGVAFAVAVLLLVFLPHEPGVTHSNMEIGAVMSLGVGMLGLLAPETLSGVSSIIKAVGGIAANIRGKKSE